jgi:acyl-CoA synthetase (NDP forming)/RimJ/RimL family protein N-acetyltransferase
LDDRLYTVAFGSRKLGGVPLVDGPVYPACDAILADGGTVHIRPIGPQDASELAAFHSHLSDESVYLRFFSFHPTLSAAEVERFTNVDQDQRMALVATLRGRIVGVARYDRVPEGSDEAEAAFVIADAHQGRGLGTLLLEHLAAFARTRGVRRFVADTLPQNRPMQEVFRRAGFVEHSHFDAGVVRVRLEIQPTEATIEAIEARWRRAAANSIRRLLAPRSVAVLREGPESAGPGSGMILRNILAAGFTGRVYAVDPEVHSVAGAQAYSRILAIPEEIDLGVVAVTPEGLRGALDDCAAKEVKGVVVVTPGSSETGLEAAVYNRGLAEQARGSGMRMIGPGSLGMINTDPSVRLNAGVTAVPPTGRIAVSTQSGPIGLSVLGEFERRRLGLSSFVSLGEKADVSGNDLLHYWQQDSSTDVILLYLESFGNPRRFAKVAREVSAVKPIVAIKAGRGVPGEDSAVDAVFSRSGVVRAGTLEELLDVAEVLAGQPLPAGRRVAIVSDSGGLAPLASDACLAEGLVLAGLSPTTAVALPGTVLDTPGPPRNPVVVDPVEGRALGRALEAVLADVAVDAVLAVLSPSASAGHGAFPSVVEAAAAGSTKPVVANLLDLPEPQQALRVAVRAVPCFPTAERAARALSAACRYGEWRAAPRGEAVALEGLDPDAARALVASAVDPGGSVTRLDDRQSIALLGAYGIPVSTRPLRDAIAEASVGVVNDPSFGPLVSLAVGGPVPPVDALARAVVPLTDVDAAALVRRSPGSALLFGPGGTDTGPAGALESILLRLAQMAHDLPDLSEVRLDPVAVGPASVRVRAASVLVAPAELEDPTLRRLG